MLFTDSLYKSFGPLEVLRDVTFTVGKGEHAGLVGPNGAGKTTLLRILAGDDEPDRGKAWVTGGESLGYLRQEAGLTPQNTLLEELWTAFPEARATEVRLHQVADALEKGEGDVDALIDEQAALFERFDRLDGYRIESRIGRVLQGLGFSVHGTRPGAPDDRDKRCGEFSGGWQMRIALAKVLVRRPDNMLLDEPTNHLDRAAQDWLAGDLAEYKGSLLIVTHDAAFLDRVVTRILELRDCEVESYPGNYSEYQRIKAERLQQQDLAAARQERELARQQRFIERFRAKNSKATLVKSREKMVARVDKIDRSRKESAVHIGLQAHGRTENDVLVLDGITHAYPSALRNSRGRATHSPGGQASSLRGGGAGEALTPDDHLVLLDINLHIERGWKVVLVGPNGSGKSTLLKIAAGFLNPTEGAVRWADSARVGYYDQHQDEALDPNLTPLEEVRSIAPLEPDSRLRTVLGNFLFHGDHVNQKISTLSGGERSRVALAKLVIQPTNVLILDEPTNHLDRTTRRKLIEVLAKYEGTILCAAHDPGLLQKVATRVYEVADGDCQELMDYRRDNPV